MLLSSLWATATIQPHDLIGRLADLTFCSAKNQRWKISPNRCIDHLNPVLIVTGQVRTFDGSIRAISARVFEGDYSTTMLRSPVDQPSSAMARSVARRPEATLNNN